MIDWLIFGCCHECFIHTHDENNFKNI